MDTKQLWLEAGYKAFADKGPDQLKIERLAKEVSRNKSSFYHYFATLEIFIGQLLSLHITQISVLAEKNVKATSINDLVTNLSQHKTDLLFNRQLRVYRKNQQYQKCFVKTNVISAESLIGVWSQVLGLTDRSYLARLVLKFSVENFFLQITEETLNKQWLEDYIGQLQTIVREFKKGTQKTR